MHLVTLGETMALLTADGPLRHQHALRLGVAGAESNLAIAAVRLGLPAAWVGRVGDDEFGALIRMTLAGQGVDVGGLRVDASAPTGLMVKERRTAVITRVDYRRSGSAGSRLGPDDLPDVDSDTLLHVTGITPALSGSARDAVRAAVERTRAAGGLVSFDVNHRTSLWATDRDAAAEYRALAAGADIVFATEPELELVTGRADAASVAALGPTEVLLKRGGNGATAWIDGAVTEAPLFAVDCVDPVGAGDAFAAGYLAERATGAPPAQRVRTAAAAGAFAVTAPGDWEGLPERAQLGWLDSTTDVVR